MTGFDIAVNGQSMCIAATPRHGVLSVGLDWIKRRPEKRLPPDNKYRTGELSLRVNGLRGDDQMHLHWFTASPQVGDIITVAIVDSDSPEEPTAVYAMNEAHPKRHLPISRLHQGQGEPYPQREESIVCFEVAVNGERQCVAGVGDARVLSLHLIWIRAPRPLPNEASSASAEVEQPILSVGGIADSDDDHSESLHWTEQPVATGDTVSIKIVRPSAYDPPLERRKRFNGCDFCRKKRTDANLISGWGVTICRACLKIYACTPTGTQPSSASPTSSAPRRCGFCTEEESPTLHVHFGVGSSAIICDKCVRSIPGKIE